MKQKITPLEQMKYKITPLEQMKYKITQTSCQEQKPIFNIIGSRKCKEVNPLLVRAKNHAKIIQAKELSSERLASYLSNKCFKSIFDRNNKITLIKIFSFILQNQLNGGHSELDRFQIVERINAYHSYSNTKHISVDQFDRALKYFSLCGIVTRFKSDSYSCNHRYSYYINIELLLKHGVNVKEQVGYLKELTILKKSANIIYNNTKEEKTSVKNSPVEREVIHKNVDNLVEKSETLVFYNFKQKRKEEMKLYIDNSHPLKTLNFVKISQIELDFKPSDEIYRWACEEQMIPKLWIEHRIPLFVEKNKLRGEKSDDWNKAFKGYVTQLLKKRYFIYEKGTLRPTKMGKTILDFCPLAREALGLANKVKEQEFKVVYDAKIKEHLDSKPRTLLEQITKTLCLIGDEKPRDYFLARVDHVEAKGNTIIIYNKRIYSISASPEKDRVIRNSVKMIFTDKEVVFRCASERHCGVKPITSNASI